MSDYKDNPGDALKSMIPEWAYKQSESCECADWVARMNRWGVEGCQRRKRRIVRHLCSQSDMLIQPFKLVPKRLREKIAEQLVAKAIDEAR